MTPCSLCSFRPKILDSPGLRSVNLCRGIRIRSLSSAGFEQKQKPQGLRERPRAQGQVGRAGHACLLCSPEGAASSHLCGRLSVTPRPAQRPSFLGRLRGPWPGWNPR